MRIKIGNWVGGAADEPAGTVAWAGGYTDLTEAPFTMYVKNVTIEDYTTNGTSYRYGDMSGRYESIVVSNNTAGGNTSYSAGESVGTNSSSSSGLNSTASSSNASSASSVALSGGAASQSGSFVLLGLMGLGCAYLYL